MPRSCLTLLLSFGALAAGCGGGVPLLHPARVLRPGEVRAGAGLSGQVALGAAPAASTPDATGGSNLSDLAVAPAVAPWVGGRIGIAGDNEAGVAYTGRALRVDGRHAFSLGGPTLSIGLGASAVAAQRIGEGGGVYGGGLDIPILLGLNSASDLYSIWIGPRAGLEFLGGRVTGLGSDPLDVTDVTARHLQVGFVVGLKVGFRHVHAALELDGAYHRADGSFGGGMSVGLDRFTLTPSGAVLITF